MKIETKFDYGQKIWSIINSKARELSITKIGISIDKDYKNKIEIKIEYYVNLNEGTDDTYKSHIVNEPNCFKTKSELIASL